MLHWLGWRGNKCRVRDVGVRRWQWSAPQAGIFKSADAIAEAFSNASVDAVTLSAEDYWRLKDTLQLDSMVLGMRQGEPTVKLLLLVHREGGIESLADLRGRKLVLLHSVTANLASIWLDTCLWKQGFSRQDEFFGQVANSSKLNKVILPVFFRQQDACVVTEKGFKTAVELNPQLGHQLRVIATSPPVVPFMFTFRAGFDRKVEEEVLAELSRWDSTPAGQQSLTLFQCDGLREYPFSAMDGTLELLDTHRRLAEAAQSNAPVVAGNPERASKEEVN